MVELFLCLVRYETVINTQDFLKAMDVLSVRQLQSLLQQWMTLEKPPSESYVSFYLEYSKAIAIRAQKLGLNRDAEEFLKWLGTISAPVMAKKFTLEGHSRTLQREREEVVLHHCVCSTKYVDCGLGQRRWSGL